MASLDYIDGEESEQLPKDEELLKEIRDRYRAWSDEWREAREQRAIDMRYIMGDPWTPEDRKERKDQGRPCINHDELTQYVNGAIGNMRAAKRGIQCAPAGNGTDDKTAELAQNLIRSIEYKSQAQGAYLNAYQAMLEGGYGFIRITHEYVSQDVDADDDQEIRILNIPNPDSVLYDPSCKKSDWSDARAVFVLDPLPKEEFKRQFPNARVVDFGEEHRRVAKDWIGEATVLVAEYWRVEISRPWNKRHTRKVEQRKVVQYLSNGVEILEKNEQPGENPPIIPIIGIERWVDEGGGPHRKISSMVRLARDPQMSLAYLCSQQMEEAGLSPKAPYIGYVGQFESDKEAWDLLTKVPRAYVQTDPIPDSANGQILPLPQRNQFTPNVAAYEVGKDSCRRAVQSAMGISPLPTAAQRDNQKSGVALERIHQQQAIGTLNFVDKFEAALAYAGRIIDSWIPEIYDAEDREIGIRLPDESSKVIRINTAQPYLDAKTQQEEQHRIGPAQHEITISAGPSNDSTRQAASDFLDLLIGNLGNLPVAPPQAAKLLSIAIKQKQLGPAGDEMANIISPDTQDQPQIPPQIQAAMAQASQRMQALDAYGKQKDQEVQALQQKLDAHVVDNQYKMAIEKMRIDADLAKAEINTRAQSTEERNQFVADIWKQLHEYDQQQQAQAMQQQHDALTQAADQQHEQQLQAMQQQHEQQLQAMQQQHEQQTQSADQAHALDLQQAQAQQEPAPGQAPQ